MDLAIAQNLVVTIADYRQWLNLDIVTLYYCSVVNELSLPLVVKYKILSDSTQTYEVHKFKKKKWVLKIPKKEVIFCFFVYF